MGAAPLDRKQFVERYARFFGRERIAAIERLGYLMIEASGEGPYVIDTEGRRFLDLWGVGGVHGLGHRPPATPR